MTETTNLLRIGKDILSRLEVELELSSYKSNVGVDEVQINKYPVSKRKIPFKEGDMVYLLSKDYAQSFHNRPTLKTLKVAEIKDTNMIDADTVTMTLDSEYSRLLAGTGILEYVLVSKKDLDRIVDYDLSEH